MRNNSAGRLLAVMRKAQGLQPAPQIAQGWATILGVTEEHPIRRAKEVARLVGLLHDQLEDTRRQLLARGTPSDTWDRPLRRVENALGLLSLGAAWKNVSEQLTTDTMAVLALLPELMSDSEEALTPEELTALHALVKDWERTLASSALPPSVLAFLHHQLALVKRALVEYPIRGAAAFSTASQEAAAAWAESYEVVKPHLSAPEVAKARDVWKQIWRIGKDVLVVGKLLRLFLIDGPDMLERAAETLRLLPPATEAPPSSPLPPRSLRGDDVDWELHSHDDIPPKEPPPD